MSYDYNANLTTYERTEIIVNEIMNEYPNMDKEIALKAASIELPIDNDNIEDARYRRLSNLLYFNKDNEIIKNRIINDMLNNYKKIKGKYNKIDNYIENIMVYLKYNVELPRYL